MGHLSYEESKSKALKIILILAAITFVEVIICLWFKGHIGGGEPKSAVMLGAIMIAMSLLKAYLIVYEFMHMKYELPGLVKTVLLPTLLLVWAVVAFFMEGDYWKNRRGEILEKDKSESHLQLEYDSNKINKDIRRMSH